MIEPTSGETQRLQPALSTTKTPTRWEIVRSSSYSAMEPPQHDVPQSIVLAKRLIACDLCRTKKIRCVGDDPCSNCVEHGAECIFSPRQRRRKGNPKGLPSLARRLARFKDLLEAARISSDDGGQLSDLLGAKVPELPHSILALGSDQPQQSPAEISQQEQRPQAIVCAGEPPGPASDAFDPLQHHAGHPSRSQLPCPVTKTPSQPDSNEAPWERLESPSQSASIDDRGDMGGYHTFQDDIEYWGPRTSMAICSQAGIAWVRERVKQPDFRVSANRFTQDVARRLKLEKRPTKERKEEPGLTDSLRFTHAYFEEAPDAALGIVRRSCFEARLRSFWASSEDEDDPCWYALRNVVFASGCRLVRSGEKGYTEAHRESWSYFENALSVHAELLYFRSSVMGVQALTLMVILWTLPLGQVFGLVELTYHSFSRHTLLRPSHARCYNICSSPTHIVLHVGKDCTYSRHHPGTYQRKRSLCGNACFGPSTASTNKSPFGPGVLRFV